MVPRLRVPARMQSGRLLLLLRPEPARVAGSWPPGIPRSGSPVPSGSGCWPALLCSPASPSPTPSPGTPSEDPWGGAAPPPRERAWARVAPGSETSYNTLAEDRGGKAGARLRGPARKLHTNKREGSHAANHKGRKASCEAEYRLKGSGRNSLHFV